MNNYTQTKRKLTYRTCTIFCVFQANERQSGHWLGATGKVAYVASISICFRSKEEEQDFHHQKNGTRCKRGRGRGRKEVSFRSFTRVIFGALFHARSSLFSPKQHGNACHASDRSGEKMTLFFFSALCSTPGEDLIPCLRSPEYSKEKRANKQTASPFKKRRHRAGTFPHPLPFSRIVSPLILSVSHTHPSPKKTLR